MTENLTLNQYINRYYPLVTLRIVPLKWMADRVGLTPQALRSRAYRLGVSGGFNHWSFDMMDEFSSLLRAMKRGNDPYFRMSVEAR